jgi:hypothetical protein
MGPSTVALALVALVAIGWDADGRRSAATAVTPDEPRCEHRPGRQHSTIPPRDAVLLGCARTASGATVALYSWPDGSGPCLTITGLPGGPRQCGRAPSELGPPVTRAISGGVIVRRSPDAKLELYGATAANVRRVVLRYRLRCGAPGRRRATLIRVEDRDALRAAGIRKPFGYFIGAVPPRARHVLAVAVDASKKARGRLEFDRLARQMHPTVFLATGR